MELPCDNDDSTLDLKASKNIFQYLSYKQNKIGCKYTLLSFNHFVFSYSRIAGQWQPKFFCNST